MTNIPWANVGYFGAVAEYFYDTAQRSILFCDVMRERGNAYHEHAAQPVPHVLDYQVEPVMDGRKLGRPVNYGLVKVVPPAGVEIDPTKRPFVVVDPRAGHGPGIGGFKADSEIGVALNAGHPCYFIGFSPTTPAQYDSGEPGTITGPHSSGRVAASIITAQPAWQLPMRQGLPSASG